MPSDELFDRALPLPFRVILLLNLGSWLWLAVLKLVERANLNFILLLKFSPQQQLQSFIKNHSVICETISLVSGLAYTLYGVFRSKSEEDYVNLIDFIPLFTIIFIFWSFNHRFHQTLRRVLKCQIDLQIRTNDILLSDSLLSYSKVGVDFLIYILHLFNMKTTYQVDNKIMINRSLGEAWNLGHVVLLIPVVIRMAQCLYEVKTNGNRIQLWNFGKYGVNGLIILTSLITERAGVLGLLQLIGACYSFFWDVSIDWELNLFDRDSLFGLRRGGDLRMFNGKKSIYYVIIAVNFLIRFNWVLRYMNFTFLELEIGVFTLQLVEIFRRFLWILLKLDVDFGKLNEFELSTYHES